MNSSYGKSNQQKGSSVSMNNFNFEFDLGIGSNRPRSLNDQKNNASSNSYFSSSSSSSFASAQPRSAWQPNKPSWTHQPTPSLAAQPGLPSGPTSMVGDISGKSWGSTPPSASNSSIGIINKDPNLFGDLVGSVLGQSSKSSSNVPLKNATPISKASGTTSNKSSFSMGNMADSLPKTSSTAQSNGSWGSSGNFGSYSSSYINNNNNSLNSNKTTNLGSTSLRSMSNGGGAAGSGMSSNKDPFGSLAGFGLKQSSSLNSAGKAKENNTRHDGFGDFQSASKPSSTSFPSSNLNSAVKAKENNTGDDGFGDFQNASKPSSTSFPSSNSTANNVNVNGSATSSQKPVQISGGDPLDVFFSSSSASGGTAATASKGFGGQPSSEIDDWGLDSEFGGGDHDAGGTTIELEGLPPPPPGVSGSTAKSKGMDNYKQGQFADAVKWLSWAVILLEKAGDNAGTAEVLSCRASCYKEVGEYKKAVADCSKVLENDKTNVSVLVQRALLYESMEKYKLGAEDLRTVLNIDPSNRVARSTIHRLNKMAD